MSTEPQRVQARVFVQSLWLLLGRRFGGVFLCLSICSYLHADVVEMNDGRLFEGTILSDDSSGVRIDLKTGQLRAIVTFPRSEVKTVTKKPLPEGFYDEPPTEERLSDPTKFSKDQTVYLEVPIIGEVGEQVFADGIVKALRYADRYGIRHVVFYIDSTSGDDIDEAFTIYEAMKKRKGRRQLFHAVIRNCLGPAMAVGLWCDSVTLMPGAKIGGLNRKVTEISSQYAKEDEEVIRAQVAHQVIEETERSGRAAQIVRAMLDPSEVLAAWRDEDDLIRLDRYPPRDIPEDRVIFQVEKGSVLQMTFEQATALGIPSVKGSVADLGEVLHLTNWTAESDYGRRVMEKTQAARNERERRKEAAFAKKVERNVSRRDMTERYIEDNMKKAAEWDPSDGSYEKYSYRWNWGWGGGSWSGTSGWEANQWTPDSQRKWRSRTDASMHFLLLGLKGMRTMKRLETEAEELGVETTYKPGELDGMIEDVKAKFAFLKTNRSRKSG